MQVAEGDEPGPFVHAPTSEHQGAKGAVAAESRRSRGGDPIGSANGAGAQPPWGSK